MQTRNRTAQANTSALVPVVDEDKPDKPESTKARKKRERAEKAAKTKKTKEDKAAATAAKTKEETQFDKELRAAERESAAEKEKLRLAEEARPPTKGRAAKDLAAKKTTEILGVGRKRLRKVDSGDEQAPKAKRKASAKVVEDDAESKAIVPAAKAAPRKKESDDEEQEGDDEHSENDEKSEAEEDWVNAKEQRKLREQLEGAEPTTIGNSEVINTTSAPRKFSRRMKPSAPSGSELDEDDLAAVKALDASRKDGSPPEKEALVSKSSSGKGKANAAPKASATPSRSKKDQSTPMEVDEEPVPAPAPEANGKGKPRGRRSGIVPAKWIENAKHLKQTTSAMEVDDPTPAQEEMVQEKKGDAGADDQEAGGTNVRGAQGAMQHVERTCAGARPGAEITQQTWFSLSTAARPPYLLQRIPLGPFIAHERRRSGCDLISAPRISSKHQAPVWQGSVDFEDAPLEYEPSAAIDLSEDGDEAEVTLQTVIGAPPPIDSDPYGYYSDPASKANAEARKYLKAATQAPQCDSSPDDEDEAPPPPKKPSTKRKPVPRPDSSDDEDEAPPPPK
ncbi:hypothetical protein PENSPDRAFT_672517, partial [Peniophora sp. CONT]